MDDSESRCTAMVDQRYSPESWAAANAAELPPFTPTEIGVVAAIVRQIDERMGRKD